MKFEKRAVFLPPDVFAAVEAASEEYGYCFPGQMMRRIIMDWARERQRRAAEVPAAEDTAEMLRRVEERYRNGG